MHPTHYKRKMDYFVCKNLTMKTAWQTMSWCPCHYSDEPSWKHGKQIFEGYYLLLLEEYSRA
jgi:hypothetical protein